jgi:hypothetical protein
MKSKGADHRTGAITGGLALVGWGGEGVSSKKREKERERERERQRDREREREREAEREATVSSAGIVRLPLDTT